MGAPITNGDEPSVAETDKENMDGGALSSNAEVSNLTAEVIEEEPKGEVLGDGQKPALLEGFGAKGSGAVIESSLDDVVKENGLGVVVEAGAEEIASEAVVEEKGDG